MGKDWGPGAVDAGYIDKSSHSTAHGPYGWPLAGQPNAACELRWTLEMVAVVEVVVVSHMNTDLGQDSVD